jgi:hypothetical protein
VSERSDDLRKMAAELRARAKETERTKQQKCASLLVGAIGLEMLDRKIRGEKP